MCVLSEMAAKQHEKPLFCYDNAGHQAHALFARMGFSRHQRVEIPPHSPDFNKVIEHVFNHIKHAVSVQCYTHQGPVDARMLQKWVRDAFSSISTASICKDVQSLVQTLTAVRAEEGRQVCVDGWFVVGTGGDYPAARLR